MIYLRRSHDRGYADHGWLKSHHSFSFANYYDPEYMGWGNLCVINEDRIAPGTGFGAHPHQDMEIISYVLEGALSHQDSMGHIQTIHPGDLQRMTAGSGVVHSERNVVDTHTHFLQIWIKPLRKGLNPAYEQRKFTLSQKKNNLFLVASPNGEGESVKINADALIYASVLDSIDGAPVRLEMTLSEKRKAYVFVIQGAVEVAGKNLTAGDAIYAENETRLLISSNDKAHFLAFDLAA